jgi:hypothetical protein
MGSLQGAHVKISCTTCAHWRPTHKRSLRAMCQLRADEGRQLAQTDALYSCARWRRWVIAQHTKGTK